MGLFGVCHLTVSLRLWGASQASWYFLLTDRLEVSITDALCPSSDEAPVEPSRSVLSEDESHFMEGPKCDTHTPVACVETVCPSRWQPQGPAWTCTLVNETWRRSMPCATGVLVMSTYLGR